MPGRRGWSLGGREAQSHGWGETSGPGTTAVGMALEVLAHSGGFRKPLERAPGGPIPAPAGSHQPRGSGVEGRGRSWLVGWTGSWVRVGGHVCPLDGKSISSPLGVFPAPPCLGLGGTLDTVISGPWAAGANQLKLPTLDHVGRRLLRPGLQGVALDPGACAAKALTLVWESPRCLLSPVPCPWGRGGGG